MSDRPYTVLFLCTGNSARSILAESIMNRLGHGRFIGYSAGSHPNGQVNPLALELLKQLEFPTEGLRSKSWDEFAAPNKVHFDFVIAFRQALKAMDTRIKLFLSLPIAGIENLRLKERMDEIGRLPPESTQS
jgi:arsenate reductase